MQKKASKITRVPNQPSMKGRDSVLPVLENLFENNYEMFYAIADFNVEDQADDLISDTFKETLDMNLNNKELSNYIINALQDKTKGLPLSQSNLQSNKENDHDQNINRILVSGMKEVDNLSDELKVILDQLTEIEIKAFLLFLNGHDYKIIKEKLDMNTKKEVKELINQIKFKLKGFLKSYSNIINDSSWKSDSDSSKPNSSFDYLNSKDSLFQLTIGQLLSYINEKDKMSSKDKWEIERKMIIGDYCFDVVAGIRKLQRDLGQDIDLKEYLEMKKIKSRKQLFEKVIS